MPMAVEGATAAVASSASRKLVDYGTEARQLNSQAGNLTKTGQERPGRCCLQPAAV